MQPARTDSRVLFKKGERRFDLGNVEVTIIAPRDIRVSEARLEGMVLYAHQNGRRATGESEASCGRVPKKKWAYAHA